MKDKSTDYAERLMKSLESSKNTAVENDRNLILKKINKKFA